MATTASDSSDWLKALEEKIGAVTREVADLRKKNRSLVSKVSRLERKARDKPDAGEAEWASERAEIRSRVEQLAGSLEGLLEEE